jgi:diketogulonate reductase-like aldo/keto reductase
VIFAFALRVGMVCLTGTTNREHMREDFASLTIELSEEEIETIESISA